MSTATRAEVFDRLLEIGLPTGGYVMALAEVYLDESGTHDGAPVLTFGGYIFRKENAQKFNAEMGKVYADFGIPCFHTSEILGGKHKPGGSGPFDHLTKDNREQLNRLMIRAIRRRMSWGFAVSINEAVYDEVVGDHPEMPTAYAFCLLQCFIHVRKWLETKHFKGRVQYFLEDGAKHKADAMAFLESEIISTPRKREMHRYAGFTLLPKDSCPAINAPDVISWQWYHYHARRAQGVIEPRKDLVRLVQGDRVNVADWGRDNIDELRVVLNMRDQDRRDAVSRALRG